MDEVLSFFDNQSGMSEGSKISHYEVVIGNHAVRVEIFDRGEGSGSSRFSVIAYTPDVPEAEREVNSVGYAVGNPDPTLQGALHEVHWNVFKPTT